MTFFSTSGQVDPIPTSTPSNAQKPLIPLLSRTSQTKAILQRQVMIYFALFALLYLNLFRCFLSRTASHQEPDEQNYSKKKQRNCKRQISFEIEKKQKLCCDALSSARIQYDRIIPRFEQEHTYATVHGGGRHIREQVKENRFQKQLSCISLDSRF